MEIDVSGEDCAELKFTIGKRFWSYIRSQKKDQIGIPVLKDGVEEISDSKRKAEILSKQYETVFTEEDTSRPLPDAQYQSEIIDDLRISIVGVRNLLDNLNCKKTNGPDQLPIRQQQQQSLLLHLFLLLALHI